MKTSITSLAAIAAATAISAGTSSALAQADAPYVGEIMWTPYTFCPRGWAEANGQLLAISSNDALFSLYGTIYGGDGRTTFGLPDLRGRVPLHEGQGPGLTSRRLGSRSGAESTTLTVSSMPSHTHSLNGTSAAANQTDPVGAALSNGRTRRIFKSTPTDPGADLGSTTTNTGAGMAHNNMAPATVLRACVALVGIYPSRS